MHMESITKVETSKLFGPHRDIGAEETDEVRTPKKTFTELGFKEGWAQENKNAANGFKDIVQKLARYRSHVDQRPWRKKTPDLATSSPLPIAGALYARWLHRLLDCVSPTLLLSHAHVQPHGIHGMQEGQHYRAYPKPYPSPRWSCSSSKSLVFRFMRETCVT